MICFPPMADAAIRRATYDDLLKVPEHLVAEIIDGVLYAQPRPAPRHAMASGVLMMQIGGPFHLGSGGPGGWVLLVEPELHLGSDVVVPDIAGWRHERMPDVPDTAYMDLAPDWVCEVLSPSTCRLDRTRKMTIYSRERVQHVWLVDPIDYTLEVFKLEGWGWVHVERFEDDAMMRAEPFDAIEINLATLWRRLRS